MSLKTNFSMSLSLLLLLVSAASAQADSSNEHKPASISGTVTNSVTGAPLPHAHVRLDQKGRATRAYGAMTDEQGRFSIATVEPGDYLVSAEHRGYASVNASDRDAKELTLKPGEEMKDFALQLIPYAVISGRVLDVNGVPFDKATVTAINGASSHQAETDDRGQFRIGGLGSGRYVVKASRGGPMPPEVRTDGTDEINYARTYYPGVRTAESAQPVQARAGEETAGIEIKMVPGPVLHVSGMVAPVGKARRYEVVLDGNHRGLEVGTDMRFTLWRFPPGQHQVLALSYDMSDSEMRSAPTVITLTNTSIEGIHLAPSAPFELAVEIKLDESAGERKGDKNPTVDLQLVGPLRHEDPDTDRNSDGSLKITDIFPGRYRVRLDESSQDFYVKSVRLGSKEFEDGILDLRSGAQKGPLIVHLATDGAEISGVVRDPKGPVAGAEVTLLYDDEFGFDVADTAHAQPDGAYAFHEVAPGKYKIFACDPKQAGNQWTSESLALYISVTETVEVGEADKITQDLKFLP